MLHFSVWFWGIFCLFWVFFFFFFVSLVKPVILRYFHYSLWGGASSVLNTEGCQLDQLGEKKVIAFLFLIVFLLLLGQQMK